MKLYLFSSSTLVLFLVACSPSTSESVVTVSQSNTPKPTITQAIPTATIKTDDDVERDEKKATAYAKVTMTEAAKATVRNLLGTARALTPTLTPSPTRTPTSTPSKTPHPSITPSITPTFDVSSIVTRTLSPPAQCPNENSELVVELSEFFEGPIENRGKIQPVLEFLNAGGSVQALGAAFEDHYSQHFEFYTKESFVHKDVTGDEVPEILLVANWRWFYILGCNGGEYQEMMQWNWDSTKAINILFVEDLNINGIPEIVIYAVGCHGDKCQNVLMFEWNENDFDHIIKWEYDDPKSRCHEMGAPFDVQTEDIDGNGTIELILHSDSPYWADDFMFPFREETRICMWNGQSFSYYSTEFAPPEYRYQAVQDGDMASLAGKYDKALDFYQQAIFSDQLEWWSLDRRIHDFNLMIAHPKPTPDPSLAPEQAEYYSLAAYSRYRILLLHLLRGWGNEAQIVYETLLEKFPEGKYGHGYAEMATEFWVEYQISQDIATACNKAISYATEHPDEILTYLGSSYHGAQSLYYRPKDVCPFR